MPHPSTERFVRRKKDAIIQATAWYALLQHVGFQVYSFCYDLMVDLFEPKPVADKTCVKRLVGCDCRYV
jgi:hypothetical protein